MVLISGTVFRDPKSVTSKAGKPFMTATIRVSGKTASEFWKVLAFSTECKDELSRLSDGDAVSVQGELSLGTYESNGEWKVERTILANHVLALRQPKQTKKSRSEEADAPVAAPASQRNAATDLDVPF